MIINKMSENQNVTMNLEPEVPSGSSGKVELEAQPEYKNVNVNVLNNIKSILEISTARGTFKATELTAVGQVYDQLSTLLQ
jgi:hypothetical protein